MMTNPIRPGGAIISTFNRLFSFNRLTLPVKNSPIFAAKSANMGGSLKNKFDSIIFDLDGTLWDSTANVALAWQAAKQQVDYIQEDFTQPMIHSITGMTY